MLVHGIQNLVEGAGDKGMLLVVNNMVLISWKGVA